VRFACECLAAAHQAHTEEQPAFLEWLGGALRPSEEHKAMEVTLGPFFAGSTIAAEADLGAVYRAASELARPHFALALAVSAAEPDPGAVYRAASELARPHFGVALAVSAPESNQQKLAVAFADQTFHLGWAQLALGWLLRICDVQLRLAQAPGAPYALTEERA